MVSQSDETIADIRVMMQQQVLFNSEQQIMGDCNWDTHKPGQTRLAQNRENNREYFILPRFLFCKPCSCPKTDESDLKQIRKVFLPIRLDRNYCARLML